jgi:L-alanine-DL-glutamate epimerase-like enolase superfamily enzyme
MLIEAVAVRVFTTTAWTAVDEAGHRHPAPEHEVMAALLEITDQDGHTGYCQVQPDHLREPVLAGHIRPALLGRDPWEREHIWQTLSRRQRGAHGGLTDRALGYVDQALWDLLGRRVGLPVWKLLGGARDRVPAYASTMCGDETPGGLSCPEDYAAFAEQLAKRGYRGIKLHTWMPPVPFAPDVQLDIRTCAAVREAVGPDVALMLDANHWYRRTEALELGRALEKLDFAWYEEPMDEASISSYRWLAQQLAVPVIGPETAGGKHFVRAEWIRAGACDILRAGVDDCGGISATLKTVHLAEAFNMDCEIHGNGSGNLAVLGASANPRWYERGLLHPHVDFDRLPPHRNSVLDAVDEDGLVAMPTAPGLGDDWNLDHVSAHTVATW